MVPSPCFACMRSVKLSRFGTIAASSKGFLTFTNPSGAASARASPRTEQNAASVCASLSVSGERRPACSWPQSRNCRLRIFLPPRPRGDSAFPAGARVTAAKARARLSQPPRLRRPVRNFRPIPRRRTRAGLPATPLKPIPKPIIARSRAEICDSLTDAAQSNDLPLPFFIRLLFQESGFRPGAVSPAGAEGVAQFMRETAADVGLDNPYDPLQAIAPPPGCCAIWRRNSAISAWPPPPIMPDRSASTNWLVKKGNLPAETQHYVKTITGRPAENWTRPRPAARRSSCSGTRPARRPPACSPGTAPSTSRCRRPASPRQ